MKRYIGTIILAVAAVTFPGCPKTDSEPSIDNDLTIAYDAQDVDRLYTAIKSLGSSESITGAWVRSNYFEGASRATKDVIMERPGSLDDTLNGMAIAMNGVPEHKRKGTLPFLKANEAVIKGNVISQAHANRILNEVNKAFGGQYSKELSGKTAYFAAGLFSKLGGAFEYGVFFDVAMLNPSGLDQTEHPFPQFLPTLPKEFEFVFTHELAHVIQLNSAAGEGFELYKVEGKTLLQGVLLEGGADYLTMLVLGKDKYNEFQKTITDHLAKTDEAKKLLDELMKESQVKVPPLGSKTPQDLENKAIITKWLYNSNVPTEELRKDGISDLGYGIGYLIAEKYFERNVADGRAAMVKALLESVFSKENANTFAEKAGITLPSA